MDGVSELIGVAAVDEAHASQENGQCTDDTLLHHLRHWLRLMEAKLSEREEAESEVWLGEEYLKELLFEQEVFQKEIERDGAVLVASIRKDEQQRLRRITKTPSRERKTCWSEDGLRCKSSCLERRWHDLWLKSLERLCRLEQQLHSIRLGLSNVQIDTADRSEPTAKRRRLDSFDQGNLTEQSAAATTRASSVVSDTIPFAEDEYESIMERTPPPVLDDNGNVVEVDTEPPTARLGASETGVVIGHPATTAITGDDSGVKACNRSSVISDGDRSCSGAENGTGYQQYKGNHLVVPDIGYASENSGHLSNYEDDHAPQCSPFPASDSESIDRQSKPFYLLTERRPHVVDPRTFKQYCKTTPALDTDGTTDTDTPRFSAPSPSGFHAFSSLPFPADYSGSRSRSKSPCVNGPALIAEPCLDDSKEELPNLKDIMDLLECGHCQYSYVSSPTSWSSLTPAKHSSTPKRLMKVPDGLCTCDASSELSMDDCQNDEPRFASSKTLLQGSNDLQSVTPAVGSFTRRRKRTRERPSSWMKSLPPSASETAIMNMSFSSSATATSPSMQLGQSDVPWLMTSSMSSSGYGGGGTGNELRMTFCKPRKKLRARRMPRSMSDGEHLSFLHGPSVRAGRDIAEAVLGKDESCDGYRRRLELEIPSAPRATPTSDSSDEEDDGRVFDGIVEFDDLDQSAALASGRNGSGEAMAVVDEVGDDGERTAGDGGSMVSTSDQSDVYEWENFMPQYNEDGAFDQEALDDSNLTAFGDDYRRYLEYMSDSSGPSSFRAKNGAFERDMATVLSGGRLHPIGRSQDSDSELEEILNRITESEKQLRHIRGLLKNKQQCSVLTLGDVRSTCNKNVKELKAILDGCQRRGFSTALRSNRKSSAKEADDIGRAKALLFEWQNLVKSVLSRIEAASAPVPARTMGRKRSSDEEEQFSDLLWKEMRWLTTSLESSRQKLAQGLPGLARTGSYKSLNEVQEDVDLLKALLRKLTIDQDRLDALIRTCKMTTRLFASRSESIGQDVQQISAGFEQARLDVHKQLRWLELLHKHWLMWQESERMCQQLSANIKSRLDELESVLKHTSLKHSASSYIEAVQVEFSKLEERLLRLELLCTELSRRHRLDTTSAFVSSLDDAAVTTIRKDTASMRRESSAFKIKMQELEQEMLVNLKIGVAGIEVRKAHENGALKERPRREPESQTFTQTSACSDTSVSASRQT